MMRNLILLVSFILIGAACSGETGESVITDGLLVAWEADGDLYVQVGDHEPLLLAEGDVIQPFIAPDGDHIAFTRGSTDQAESLWVVAGDGESAPRRVDVAGLIGQVSWLAGDMLLFNTLESDPLGPIPRDDLLRVDVAAVDEVLPVSRIQPGGQFSVSPNWSTLVIIQPGVYDEEPGAIYVVDMTLDEADTEALRVLEFLAVATGAHHRFYPSVHWLDSETFHLALPDADAIYTEAASERPSVALWRLTTAGDAEQIGGIEASFFGLPRWSPGGEMLAYLRRDQLDVNRFALMIADGDGANLDVYAAGEAGTLALPVWVGDGRFVYAADDAYWIGVRGESPQRWLDDPLGSPRVAGNGVVYVVLSEAGYALRRAIIDGEAVTLAETQSPPRYDVRVLRMS